MAARDRLLVRGGLLALAALGGCASEDPLVLIDAGLFAPTFDGTVALSDTTSTSMGDVDVGSDLDLGGTEHVPMVRAEGDLGPFLLTASWFSTSQDGTGFVNADFGDITAGSTVDTEIDASIASGRAIFDFIDTDLVKTGLGVAVDYVDLELRAEEDTFGISEDIDIQQAVPLLAAHGAVRIPLPIDMALRLDLHAAGIAAEFGDVDGTMLDLEAVLRGEWSWFGLFAGYRYILVDIEGEIDDEFFDGDVNLSGWQVGLTVRF